MPVPRLGYNLCIVEAAAILGQPDSIERTAAFAEWLQSLYPSDPPVLVGGSAVELYTKRQQEAAIEDAMDQRKLVNVAVVQRPGLPLQRTDSTKVPLLLAIISGLAVSFGGAFGLEYLNRTLRFERDVERYLGLPVIGTVSEAKK